MSTAKMIGCGAICKKTGMKCRLGKSHLGKTPHLTDDVFWHDEVSREGYNGKL